MKDIAFKRPRQTEACRTFSVENETKMKLPPTSNFVPPPSPKAPWLLRTPRDAFVCVVPFSISFSLATGRRCA